MNKYRNYPMFIMAEGGEDSGSQERMDFAAVSAGRVKIGDDTKAALATLESGTQVVNTNFGTSGVAMRGGASNFVNTKWNTLTTRFANFSKYITSTLDSVQTATKTNESFEDKVQELFAQLGMEGEIEDLPGVSSSSAGVGGNATTAFYTEK